MGELQDTAVFLHEYSKWQKEQKILAADASPEAFLLHRAKEQAMEKLVKIADLMEEADWEDPLLDDIWKIINDE
ncbi:MAG: hypothetical protein E6R03_17465 [Hyphomicrobiaceae bacterium]|nr:MAG: hypothetical protein E6R03_17465 [Hyphomicrobiaceae bacterium]